MFASSSSNDSPLDIELCRLQLERDGLHFEWRSTATEAGVRAALREFQPDIVICDYSPAAVRREALTLYPSTGFEAARPRALGFDHEDVAGNAWQAGAIDCLAGTNHAPLAARSSTRAQRVIARRRYEARIQRISN